MACLNRIRGYLRSHRNTNSIMRERCHVASISINCSIADYAGWEQFGTWHLIGFPLQNKRCWYPKSWSKVSLTMSINRMYLDSNHIYKDINHMYLNVSMWLIYINHMNYNFQASKPTSGTVEACSWRTLINRAGEALSGDQGLGKALISWWECRNPKERGLIL